MAPPGSDPHAWLETPAIWRVSDIALSVIMLIGGVFALYGASDYPAGDWSRMGPRLFPSAVAGLLCVVAVVLLLRAALRRSPPVRPSRPLYVAGVIVLVAVVVLLHFHAADTLGAPLLLRMGAAEYVALIALYLAIAIALAHSSRTRAAGMVLLGLLLSTVGVDVNSGMSRFDMGVVELSDGFRSTLAAGLFIVGDALVCLVSPSFFLRTYTRLITAWRIRHLPVSAAFIMRIAAALIIFLACYNTYVDEQSYIHVAVIIAFGVLGVAAKIFAWNRNLVCLAFAWGAFVEENVRRALLISRGDPLEFMRRPISGALLVAAMIILTSAMVLSVRRAARDAKQHPAKADS